MSRCSRHGGGRCIFNVLKLVSMYDKQGSVLRVETTINDVAGFIRREADEDAALA